MSKKRVLSLGLNQENFIGQLYGSIKKNSDDYIFDIDNYIDISKSKVNDKSSAYQNFYNFKETTVTANKALSSLITLLGKKTFYQNIKFEFFLKRTFKHVYSRIKKNIKNYYITTKVIQPLSHDIYHIHSAVPIHFKYLDYLPQNAKVIITYWGLDLYQYPGIKNFYYTEKALNRASIITIQNIEMKEVLMARFGQHLRDKIRVLTFPLQKNIYDQIDKFRSSTTDLLDFKKNLGIATDKKILTIGYNAAINNQHIPILNEINKLSTSIKKTIEVVLPLTYGRDESYLRELDQAIASLDNIEVKKIEEYLSREDLAKLKLISDIAFQMPLNDAMSSAVLEVMYASNIVISGSWLPYGKYRRSNLIYEEIPSYEDIGSKTIEVLNSLETLKEKAKRNKENIRSVFLSESVEKAWLNIYQELS